MQGGETGAAPRRGVVGARGLGRSGMSQAALPGRQAGWHSSHPRCRSLRLVWLPARLAFRARLRVVGRGIKHTHPPAYPPNPTTADVLFLPTAYTLTLCPPAL